MKKLATIILGVSLFASSSLFAMGNFSAFYPAEDAEGSSYASLHEDTMDTSGIALSLDSTTRSVKIDTSFDAFYPMEENEVSSYASIHEGTVDTSGIALSLDSRSRTAGTDMTFDAFYPMEDDDSSSY